MTINTPSFELAKTLLTTNTFQELDLSNDFFRTLTFEQIQEIADLCSDRNRVQLFNLNNYQSEVAKHLKAFSYEQQHEIALLYLECLFKKESNSYTNSELNRLELDLTAHTNAYYDLLNTFI